MTTQSSTIDTLFIANRGEIARRIALGAQGLGIASVALYSGKAPPAFLLGIVSRFIKVNEESPSLYLDAKKMIAYAREAGCDAVHPGFGFLSENAEFAHLVQAAGLTWVGPAPSSIEGMASKAAARAIAKSHQVPIVPGLEKVEDPQLIAEFAATHGFPILLKAAMGGGGKGMRVVRSQGEIAEAVQRAQSEAINAFGDGTLIVERYVEHPRHIEVQILGDQHGNVYALGDRDCSVQRRHQKIIEEAPAPGLTIKTRKALHDAAIRLAQAVQYYSAGTVEFLMDWSPEHREQQNFYFLEMNTRLQVEHPVTEEILNEDLVAWQLRIARGESLKDRINTAPQGHSIELRIYAEDSQNKFMPAPGPVHGFLPYHDLGLRWEVGIDRIDEITARFDPMIAKLVARGRDRSQAIQRLIVALKHSVLAVATSNHSFLLDVLENKGFSDAQPTTRFIEEQIQAMELKADQRRATYQPLVPQLWSAIESGLKDPVQNLEQSALDKLTVSVFHDKPPSTPQPSVTFHEQQKLLAGDRYPGEGIQCGRGQFTCGEIRGAFVYSTRRTKDLWVRWLCVEGESFFTAENQDTISNVARSGAQADSIHAPVPGKVVKILVNAGDDVKERQTLMILESMKMEFEVQASRHGTIAEVKTKAGQQVQADEILATWHKDADS